MTTAIVCSAILAGSIFVLGFNVSRMRGVVGPDGNQQPTDPADRLLIAQRAHGNASEYVPSLIAMFLLVGWLAPTPWALTLIVGATVSRIAHAYLMLTAPSLAEEFLRRTIASMGTYAFGLLLAVTVVVAAV
jgi:uncharacterized membrane protein YecN with MAPEG domain